jgi:hypothetical protein
LGLVYLDGRKLRFVMILRQANGSRNLGAGNNKALGIPTNHRCGFRLMYGSSRKATVFCLGRSLTVFESAKRAEGLPPVSPVTYARGRSHSVNRTSYQGILLSLGYVPRRDVLQHEVTRACKARGLLNPRPLLVSLNQAAKRGEGCVQERNAGK